MENTELTMFRQTVKYESGLIWIKPVCDLFKLNVQNMHRKLKKDSILQNLWIKKSTDLGEIDKNGRILLSKKGFVRWIQIINVNTIVVHLREKFSQYQTLVFDYVYGASDREHQMQVNIQRIYKLEKLYSKIGLEIRRTKTDINLYLSEKYLQTSINFNQAKHLKN